mmetsp:Transcript_121820/g.327194  ORF Transcript_121820/g.327194 Transcript_121820/m.327194 type:complete len:296 (-) Transcript_121820:133-1020(-)
MDREGGVRHLHQRHPQVPRGPARRAGDVGLAARGRGQVRGRWRQQLPGGVAGQERPEVGLRGRHVLDLLQGGHPAGGGRGARGGLAVRDRRGQLRAHRPRRQVPEQQGPRYRRGVRYHRVREGAVLPRQRGLQRVRRVLRRRRVHHQPRRPAAAADWRRSGAALGLRPHTLAERHDDQLPAQEARRAHEQGPHDVRVPHVRDHGVQARRADGAHRALPEARRHAVVPRARPGGPGLCEDAAGRGGLQPRLRRRDEHLGLGARVRRVPAEGGAVAQFSEVVTHRRGLVRGVVEALR